MPKSRLLDANFKMGLEAALMNCKKWTIRAVALLGGLMLWSLESQAEHYMVPLFVSGSTPDGSQGVLRVINRTEESGTVAVYAIDDDGMRSGPATFMLGAHAAAEFDAGDFANGNTLKGLSGSLGSSRINRRLEIDTDLEIEPLALVRAADGTLAVMHDMVRRSVGASHSRYEIPIFNPATNLTQASRLRLINPGEVSSAVTISARDDTGTRATGGEVLLSILGNGVRTFTAQQLEAGDASITGRLGAGVDRWTLSVSADQPIQVVNVMVASTGYWNNLSTSAVQGPAPANHGAFRERMDGLDIVYDTEDGRVTLTALAGDRYTESGEVDDVVSTSTGSYRYAGLGPDSDRLTLTYDDGDECRANFHFTSRMNGWFASHCTDSNDPDGYWLGGVWFVDDGVDSSPVLGDGGPADQSYMTGTAIDTLTLPTGSGGDGILTYSLSPTVPGLSFDPATLRLSGTPSAVGAYAMTYTVRDDDGDTDTRNFTITVVASDAVAEGDCYVGLTVGPGGERAAPTRIQVMRSLSTDRARDRSCSCLRMLHYELSTRQSTDGSTTLASPTREKESGASTASPEVLNRSPATVARVSSRNCIEELGWRRKTAVRYTTAMTIPTHSRLRTRSSPTSAASTVRTQKSVLPRRARPISSTLSPARRRTTAACVRRAPIQSGRLHGTFST